MDQLETMVEHCKMLGDKTRLTLLALLREKSLCVCDLADLLGATQPNVSQHLRKLKGAGLVSETRKGQWIYYSLSIDDKPYIRELLEHVPSLKEKLDRHPYNNCCD